MNWWKNIAFFLAGIISGLLILLRFKKPDTIITADTYIDDQNQKIGKIKQKGKGNRQEVEQDLEQATPKQLRKAKRLARKTN